MTTHNTRRSPPVLTLIVALMAMVLSCGGADEASTFQFAELSVEASEPQYVENTEDGSSSDQFSDGPGRLLEYQGPAGAAGAAGAAGPPGTDGPSDDGTLRVARAATAAPSAAPTAAPAPTPSQPKAVPASGDPGQVRVSDSSQGQTARQLIVESWFGLEVDDIDAAVRHVETIATQWGGWLESAEIIGEAGYRSASIRLRVPADRLENALHALRGLGRVADEGVSSTDVTERLIDNEARLSAWHAQEERLVTLLENAPTVEDIIRIEERIAQVRSDIERVEATQRNLTDRVTTSLITVNLRLPAQFAADPPHGVLHLSVGDPSATADAITARVASLGGYLGEKREYEENRGRVVDLVVFVRSADLAQLMDYAATLGSPSGRQLNSVGPSPINGVPNARLTLGIRSNVDLYASLSLSTAHPMDVAGQIRDQAVSQGGFVEHWNESRRDERQHVSMELVVKASDLRTIMDFGAGLGDIEGWEYNAAGENPAVDAPSARLAVSVSSEEKLPDVWIIAVVLAVVIVGICAAVVALLLYRRRRTNPAGAVQMLETDATG